MELTTSQDGLFVRRNKYEGKEEQYLSLRKMLATPSARLFSKNNRIGDEDVPAPPEAAQSVHQALAPMLAGAQLLGLMPVCGVLSPTPQRLVFRWRTARVFYSGGVLTGLAVVTALSCNHVTTTIKNDTDGFIKSIGSATAGAVFYGCSTLSVLLFLRLAPRWPALIHYWHKIECDQSSMLGWPPICWKTRFLASLIMSLGFVEHVLSILVHVQECLRGQHEVCSSAGDFLRLYMCRSHGFLFSSTVPYSVPLAVLVVVASELATFGWNYCDLFVVLMGWTLATRLRALNQHLLRQDLHLTSRTQWGVFRSHYAAISNLIKMVDENVSPIILLSFTSNLYFICLQLLNGLSPKSTSALDYIYFFGSFIFLLARTIMVTLFAAQVHDESRVALPVLYTCPPESYCIEVQRLQCQLTDDELSLTGMRFFSITRSFLMAVAGAIVTYEVILIQFSATFTSFEGQTTKAPTTTTTTTSSTPQPL